MSTAILIDGAFFLKRFRHVYRDRKADDPKAVAKTMYDMACFHLNDRQGHRKHDLHRIFFYDCPPLLVPAAKLARREGIDFILDPMWNPIHPSLNEHIDGLRSTSPNPARPSAPHELDPPDEGRERRSSPAHHQHA